MLHKNGQRRLTGNLDETVSAALERQLGNQGHRANSGRTVQFLQQLLVKRQFLVKRFVTSRGQLDYCGEHLVRLDADVGVAQILKRAQEQSSAGQQRQRKGDLACDERIANPASPP